MSLVEELATFIKIVMFSRAGSLREPQLSLCMRVRFCVGFFVVNSSGQRRLASWLPFEESRCFYISDLRKECGRGQSSVAFFASVGRGCASIGKGCLHQGSLNGQLCDPLLSTHHPPPPTKA